MRGQGKTAVLSVGRLYCDLIFADLPRMPTLGTEVFTEDFGAHAGGGAFVTAAHLSQLGHSCALAAMLPASPFSDLMRPDLEASNLDLSLCAPLSRADGPQITVAMAQAADRSFLTRRAGPPFPKLAEKELARRHIKHIHIGEIASLIARPEVIGVARSLGATISVDCGWDDAFDANAIRPFIGAIDVFMPNEDEMTALRKLGLGSGIAPVTVIKKGQKGATYLSADGTYSAPALATEVLDTTGAGDAFNAGFLSCWLDGASPQTCLEAGNLRGAMAVRSTGGFTPETARKSELGVAEG